MQSYSVQTATTPLPFIYSTHVKTGGRKASCHFGLFTNLSTKNENHCCTELDLGGYATSSVWFSLYSVRSNDCMSALKGVRCRRRGKESSKVDIYNIFSSTFRFNLGLQIFLVQDTEGTCCDSGFGWSYEILLLILCSRHEFRFWFFHIDYEAWPQVWYWNKAIHLGDYEMSVLYWIVF